MIGEFERATLLKKFEAVVLRYPNRKLYSLNQNRYISHKEIFKLIAESKTFVVVDNQTNVDVTEEVLRSMAASAITDGFVLMSDVKLILYRTSSKKGAA